ncbi:DELTA-sagatoxin-Srs1a [Merluccius polli]|uniref:DELTA-sagatoxin-Srs1a n=1 Tax=Merluccius polli TaxID=89951 RepID=A0AA47M001_MERPO|nr:DELTA-sagatoxin-Srs1a [Merluccius polli]
MCLQAPEATMPETAESHATALTTNRNCTIEVTNVSSSYCLVNPKVYMSSGFCFSPPQPTVRTGQTEVCSFTKDDNTASGAVGVLTYELFEMRQRYCNEKMAVMFSVPFDYNLYKNWLGVGIMSCSGPSDEELYNLMYYEKDFKESLRHEADGSGVMYTGKMLDVRGTMSSEGRAIIKLELYDKM